MNKTGKLSGKLAIGLALIFIGLIVTAKENIYVGVTMIGVGIYLVAKD